MHLIAGSWRGGSSAWWGPGVMEESGGRSFVKGALISSFETRVPGNGGQEEKGPCTIFRPGGREDFKHCLQKWQASSCITFTFLFCSFLCFLFYIVCSVLDKDSLESKVLVL